MIVAFILIGRLLEERAKHSTTAAIRKLMGLQEKGTVARPGEILLVKPGERLAVDGVVTDGSSYVDESMLTGEPVPALCGACIGKRDELMPNGSEDLPTYVNTFLEKK
jgi:Cu2+-exporting ATPase